MHVLALNCGSSSFKSALVHADSGHRRFEWQAAMEDPAAAVHGLFDAIASHDAAPRPDAVAHRVVHGGPRFDGAVALDAATLAAIEALTPLAPLHQPPAVATIHAALQTWPEVPHVAVFDTAFHSTLPPAAREYALPGELRRGLGLRRYGFHGLSHAHVARTAGQALRASGAGTRRIVSCHLGNGASVCAIEDGRSVETSMGMTPLEGLVMGTRAGDLDPGVLIELQRRGGMDVDALDDLLNRRAGLAGLAGVADMRAIEERAAAGDADCVLAIEVYAHRIRKYIGAYAAVLGGVDAVAFTGGIGENSAEVRSRCVRGLEHLGITLDDARNRGLRPDPQGSCVDVSAAGSRARTMVVRADEEAQMARETAALLARRG